MYRGVLLSLVLVGSCLAQLEKPDDQVNVTVSIHVTTANFDEATRTLSGMIWLNMKWKDERLAHPKASRHFAPGGIWTPDLTFFHSPFHAEPTDAIVSGDGTVFWAPKVTYSETCVHGAIRFFPKDFYVCRLSIGSWTYGKSELALAIGEQSTPVLKPLQENSVWAITLKDVTLYEKVYPIMPDETFPKALYDFKLERKNSSLGVILIFPAIMTALMTIAMFLLPAECREKVTFGAVIFLSLILIIKDLPSVLPAGGVTAISCYYAVNLGFVSVTLLIHCCFVVIAYPANSSIRPHRIVRKFASSFSSVSCFANEHLELDDTDFEDPDMSNSAKGARNIAEWRFVTRMIDRLLLFLFTFLLILMGVLSIVMADEKMVEPNV